MSLVHLDLDSRSTCSQRQAKETGNKSGKVLRMDGPCCYSIASLCFSFLGSLFLLLPNYLISSASFSNRQLIKIAVRLRLATDAYSCRLGPRPPLTMFPYWESCHSHQHAIYVLNITISKILVCMLLPHLRSLLGELSCRARTLLLSENRLSVQLHRFIVVVRIRVPACPR